MPALTLPFYKLSPGGNPTILIRENSLLASPYGPEDRAAIARALMDPDHLGAEQVGFLDTSRSLPHMEMMGGEFCVNAIRSAALIFARLGLLPEGQTPGCREGSVTTSGAGAPIPVRVSPIPGPCAPETGLPGSMAMEAAIALPLPKDATDSLVTECAHGEVLVRLPGITHLLLDANVHSLPDSPLDAAAAKRAAYGLDAEEAAGVIWHVPGPAKTVAITPVVRVAATGSSVVETACGSGSLAVALLMARSGGSGFILRQPSGHAITVAFAAYAASPGHLLGHMLAWISGPVRLIAEGTANVSW
ncbi:Diaminopimelate epimerase-like protein [uncultured delta proteobacterium]|uniref:Diaminopimelate epimerase-like protein n=1 Tax=uncultured delta proteobacterium TaxID=34034 RepID=A0A212J579_9DELT|nr:Diaminopimelate epimerase-like protein [uncultured delta proteobacterium]